MDKRTENLYLSADILKTLKETSRSLVVVRPRWESSHNRFCPIT